MSLGPDSRIFLLTNDGVKLSQPAKTLDSLRNPVKGDSRGQNSAFNRRSPAKVYIGRPCFRCKRTKRYASSHGCVFCMKAATRRRYLADPEGWESKSRAWKRAHPELVKGRGKRWQAENPEKLALYGWRKNIKKLYGLTQVKFETQLAFQKGVCAICGKKNKNGRRLSVDHSHNTGDLRGLLCFGCNNVLGHGFDSVEILQAAIAYLLAGGVWQTKK